MSAGESAVLRSAKPHVGKENSMLPPLTSPSRVLSLSRGQKFASPKSDYVLRSNSEEDSKIHKAASPVQTDKMVPNQQRRVQQLEKSILFMREHHEKIVSALHEEIEELKRKNKELNFRLVMSPASLPAHLLSPEEDQPPASSPRHQAARSATPAAGHPVQLELLEGELSELRDTLRTERERSDRLAAHLRQAEAERNVSSSPAPPSAEVTALEQRLTTAENTIRELRKERDDCQREIQRMRGSVHFRPPWRAGGQQVRPPAPQTGRAATKTPAGAGAAQQQQQLPRLPAANSNSGTRQDTGRSSTAPGRPGDSRTASQGSLPALPRGRARQQTQPPPPPPPRHHKQ